MKYTPLGKYDKNKAGHQEIYFSERHCNIDYRGNLKVSPLSYWGFGVTVITATHGITAGEFSPPIVFKEVIVDDYAWVTSMSVLYNCHVQHHGIVAIGACVAGVIVEPYTIVAGNPAQLIARWDGSKWCKIKNEALKKYGTRKEILNT